MIIQIVEGLSVRLDPNSVHKNLNINLEPRVNFEKLETTKHEIVDEKNPASKIFSQDNLQKEWKSTTDAKILPG